MKKAIIYIHGKGGSALEAERYKKNCAGFSIFGVDYNGYLPWIVQSQIKTVYDDLARKHEHISIIANSIGAYFAMHSLQNCAIKKALFISPILDMERPKYSYGRSHGLRLLPHPVQLRQTALYSPSHQNAPLLHF